MKQLVLALAFLAPQETNPQPLAIGSPAPDFSLPGVDDKPVSLNDFAAKKLLLVLFDTVHCPTSQNYTGRIKKLHEDYKDKSVGLVVISPNDPKAVRLDELGYTDLDDSRESMAIRARDKGYAFPFLFDGEPNRVSQAYGPKATPHAFLFDAGRKLRYQGGIDDSEWEDRVKAQPLRNALDALLEGKPVPAETTRVFGCSTKWPNKRKANEEFNARIQAEEVALESADAAALKALRAEASPNVRLVHVWSTEAPKRLVGCTFMYHMYRNRNFQFVSVAVESESRKAEVLAGLKVTPPPGTNPKLPGKVRNLLVPDARALDADWDGTLPFTLVLSASNEVLYRKSGALDELECRRAIVRNLKEDRRPAR
jgi:thiol-disulfide isomerase/thioredoxin